MYRDTVRKFLRESGLPFLIGTLTYEVGINPKDVALYNSALLLDDQASTSNSYFYDQRDLYSKVHLVPFGEYIPLNDRFPQIGQMVGMGRNLTPGKSFRPLEIVPGVRAGAVICYEDVFPYVSRELARNGANLLVVITNDAWYPLSDEPQQHYVNSIFRTVETRLPMIRCGNSDYSVLIDSTGKTVDSASFIMNGNEKILTPEKKQACSTVFQVPVPSVYAPTFYVRYGDLFVLFCWILFFCGFFFSCYQCFLYRKTLQAPFQEKLEDNAPLQ